MHKLHAIYGFKFNKENKLTYTSTNGWPNNLGSKILSMICENSDEQLKNLYDKLIVSSKTTNNDLSKGNEIKKCPMLQAEYKYIINLNNMTLEYYCHNNIPRAIFSLDNIRKNSITESVNAMNVLDEPTKNMYDLFSLSA